LLKLKRVELQGFKSFCDRSELKFNGGGIAAIVGPNGCGKSNLSDAISWVLGEQSAKTLRGTRMEDVIFAGTRDRKPLGMAYVTLTLVDPSAHDGGDAVVNANGHAASVHINGSHVVAHAPQRPGEVTITRRLYRSGDSEYLINGHTARLRDIQDLFTGTGLGPESYAIIEQGRIGQILSSKPQDRRAIIEEAAGITRYKTRKRLAEAKLESARQNLARVFDILEEVTRQVNSLKRQAAKARRYTELKTEMEGRLRVVLSGRFRLLEREAARSALDLNMASSELRALTEQVAAQEQEHENLQGSCYETEQKLTDARALLAERNVDVERTRGRLEAQVKESGAIEQRIAQAESESQELDQRLGRLQAELEAHGGAVQELERQISGARERLIEKNRRREDLQTRLRDREKAIETGRMQVLRLLGEASNLRNQLAQIDEYLAGIDRETARSRQEEEGATAELERLGAARASLSETTAQRQLELETVTGQRRPRRAPPWTGCATSARSSPPARNPSSRCWRTAPIPPPPSSGSSPNWRRARPTACGPWVCWLILSKWTRRSKSRPKSSFTTSSNTWWWKAGATPPGAWISCAPSWTAAPRSWSIRRRTATASRCCRSRPSGRPPGSWPASASRCD
jgi:chromosome segregation protein